MTTFLLAVFPIEQKRRHDSKTGKIYLTQIISICCNWPFTALSYSDLYHSKTVITTPCKTPSGLKAETDCQEKYLIQFLEMPKLQKVQLLENFKVYTLTTPLSS